MSLPGMWIADATGASVSMSAILNCRVVDRSCVISNAVNVRSYVNKNGQPVLKQVVGTYTYDQLKSDGHGQ